MTQKGLILVFDFDGTLTQNKVPTYLASNAYNMSKGTTSNKFLARVTALNRFTGDDPVKCFYRVLMQYVKKYNISSNDFIESCQMRTCEHVEDFLCNIKNIGNQLQVPVDFYVLTSGIAEVIKMLPIAKHFKAIIGESFVYDNCGNIIGLYGETGSHKKLYTLRKIFKLSQNNNIVYLGDGYTDISAMQFVQKNGGRSILLHDNFDNKGVYQKLLNKRIETLYLPKDYSRGGTVENTITRMLQDCIENETLFN